MQNKFNVTTMPSRLTHLAKVVVSGFPVNIGSELKPRHCYAGIEVFLPYIRSPVTYTLHTMT